MSGDGGRGKGAVHGSLVLKPLQAKPTEGRNVTATLLKAKRKSYKLQSRKGYKEP